MRVGVPLYDVHVPRTALLFVKTRFHARHHYLHAANVISFLPQRRRIKANNIADLGTKAVNEETFKRLIDYLMGTGKDTNFGFDL